MSLSVTEAYQRQGDASKHRENATWNIHRNWGIASLKVYLLFALSTP